MTDAEFKAAAIERPDPALAHDPETRLARALVGVPIQYWPGARLFDAHPVAATAAVTAFSPLLDGGVYIFARIDQMGTRALYVGARPAPGESWSQGLRSAGAAGPLVVPPQIITGAPRS